MNLQTIRKTLAVVAAIVVAGGALALGGDTPWKNKPQRSRPVLVIKSECQFVW
jgi:hypothetical protein